MTLESNFFVYAFDMLFAYFGNPILLIGAMAVVLALIFDVFKMPLLLNFILINIFVLVASLFTHSFAGAFGGIIMLNIVFLVMYLILRIFKVG